MRGGGSSSLGRQKNMLSVIEMQLEGAMGTGGSRRTGGTGRIFPASSTPA